MTEEFPFDPFLFGVAFVVFVVVLAILIFFLRGSGTKRRTVLIAGISDSGKTILFSQLVFSKYIESFTSIKENSGLFWVESKKIDVPIVDIPGNDRQRLQYWDRYKDQIKGLIFVIDSSTFQKQIKEVAEYLYTLLTDPEFSGSKSQLLVACNKQDIPTAKSAKIVQTQLEKELNTLRLTRAASLDTTGDSGRSDYFLGKKGKDFEFSHLSSMKVEFLGCTGKNPDDSEDGVDGVVNWINKVA